MTDAELAKLQQSTYEMKDVCEMIVKCAHRIENFVSVEHTRVDTKNVAKQLKDLQAMLDTLAYHTTKFM